MQISHNDHNNTIQVYSATVMTHVLKHLGPDNLDRGHMNLLHRRRIPEVALWAAKQANTSKSDISSRNCTIGFEFETYGI